MTTIKMKVSDEVLEKLKLLLKEFDHGEVEILEEINDFDLVKTEVHEELARYESGIANTYTIEEADAFLEETIKRHEN